mgnify:FL=1
MKLNTKKEWLTFYISSFCPFLLYLKEPDVLFRLLMCTHISAFRTAKNLRMSALKHIVKLPLGYFNTIGSGKLRRIIDESSGQTESFLAHQLPDLVGAFVTPIATVILLFLFDWRLGLISLAPTLISFIFLMQMMGPSLADV